MTDSNTIYVTTDGSNTSQKLINAAIKSAYTNKKTTVYLNAGTFVISDPIELYSGITLCGAGKDKTIIKLVDGAYANTTSKFYIKPAYYKTYSDMIPLIWPVNSTAKVVASANNVTFHDFSVNGNFSGNSAISRGRGYYNIIYFNNSKNIEVYNVHFYDSHGDGFRGSYVDTVNIHDSTFERLGHDAIFFLRSDDCHNYNNKVAIQTNSAGRFNDCTNSSAYNNEVYAYAKKGDAGNGSYQLERQYKSTISVDIYNNYIHDIWGCGIWIVKNTKAIAESGKSKVHVYNNKFVNCGLNSNIYYIGGIVHDQIQGLTVENNVFDGCYNSAYVCMGMTDTATASVKVSGVFQNNIVINTKKRGYKPDGTGYGLHNRYTTTHKITFRNNCVYNNAGGNYKNVTSSNDVNKDPLLNSDYTLKSNSPCLKTGYNSANIGLTSSSTDTDTTESATTVTSTSTTETTATTTVKDTAVSSNVASSTKVTLYASDSYRLKQNYDKVMKNDTFIDTGTLNGVTYRNIIYFDLSKIKDKTITSAKLALYWYYPANTKRKNSTVVEVYRPMSYDKSYVSWITRASGTKWINTGGNWYDKDKVVNGSNSYGSATFNNTTVPSNAYQYIDVTELIKQYCSGTTNTGMFLKAKSESDNYIAFYSANYPATNKKIQLLVEYTE